MVSNDYVKDHTRPYVLRVCHYYAIDVYRIYRRIGFTF